jgi:HNH endonuclease
MAPLSPGRFELRLTIDDETQDLLQRARALMSHQIPTGEIAPVLKRALTLFVTHHEQRKYAATSKPRPQPQGAVSNPRHIPASVKRAVRERDGDRCAFVGESGQRCSSRARLEFDHIDPVARGGASTVENLRLLCRAHNQYTAEQEFGAEFMEQKRAEAQHTPAAR